MRRRKTQPVLNFSVLIVVATIGIAGSADTIAQINDPRDLSGNVLWLDGSDVDGDFVTGGSFVNGTTWIDKSTASNADASQSVASATPTVLSSSFNGLTAVDFDGNDFLDVASTAFGALRNVEGATMIGFLATDVQSSNRALRALMISSGTNSAATRAGINLFDSFGTSVGGTGDFGLAGRRLDSDGFQRIEGGSVTPSELASVTGVFNYLNGEATLLVDGAVETQVPFQSAGTTSDTDSLNIRVGADAALGSPRGFFNGQIAELIVYDRVLDEAELASVQAYFAQKWTMALLLGDVNRDGVVDFSDINAFIDVLIAGGFQEEADINGDGAVDFSDIPSFIDLLIAQ